MFNPGTTLQAEIEKEEQEIFKIQEYMEYKKEELLKAWLIRRVDHPHNADEQIAVIEFRTEMNAYGFEIKKHQQRIERLKAILAQVDQDEFRQQMDEYFNVLDGIIRKNSGQQ